MVSRSLLSVVTNTPVPVLQTQHAVILVYWRFPETQHPGSASTTGQSHMATFSDEMSVLDSAGLDDCRVPLTPPPREQQQQQEEQEEGERGRRCGADHHQGQGGTS